MSTIIGIKELRQHATQIADRVQRGEHFTVVKRSKPVFDITPTAQYDPRLEATKAWTRRLVTEHRPAFEALADK